MTGSGTFQTTKTPDQKDVLWYYWRKGNTMFAANTPSEGYAHSAAVIRLGGIAIARPRPQT